MKLFFSVGEPSGDQHAANLTRALRQQQPDLAATGFGGPQMEAAGCELLHDMTSLAVMGLGPAVAGLPQFAKLLARANRYFAHQRPDAVVLVDYPGFNWWIARCAKRHRIPVYYYCPPLVWAWARWRVSKLRRLVDHVLCTLPFEAAWLNEKGCHATYVGHPYFDDVRLKQLDREFVAGERLRTSRLVTILPGSRTREVKDNLPGLLKAAVRVRAEVSDVRFAVAAFKPAHAELAKEMAQVHDLPLDVHVGRTQELMHLATCCLAVSGSVSLELLYHTRPTAILYQLSRGSFWLYNALLKVPYITLVNLISTGRLERAPAKTVDDSTASDANVLFPEYPTCEDRSPQLAAHVVEWLTDEDRYSDRVAELAELKARLCHGGASRKAANYLLTTLTHHSEQIPRPHFLPGTPAQGKRKT